MKDFDCFDNFTLPTEGRHTCKVQGFDMVKPENGQPYILVQLFGGDCAAFETRIYSARVPYFMAAVARQTCGAIGGLRLSEVLDYLTKHTFDVWVKYDKDYGLQVNYSEPRK